MGPFLNEIVGTLLATVVIAIVKLPLALLAWRWMLNIFDFAIGINFAEVFQNLDSEARGRYLGMRAIAAALISAAVFL